MLIVLTLLSRVAAADDNDHPFRDLHTEIDVGFTTGGYAIGGMHQHADGPSIALGRRHDRWTALAEYTPLWFGGGDMLDGVAHRLGGGVRVDLAPAGISEGTLWAGGHLWLEASAALEHARWESGATIDRGDLGLTLGAQYTIAWGRRSVGVHYAAQAIVARGAPRTMVAALCKGSCSPPGGGADVGVFFTAALDLGR